MTHRITIFASMIAALVLTVQPADAFFRHPKVDPRVSDVSLGAGILSTIGYFALANNDHHNSIHWGAFAVTTAACVVGAPMVAAALVRDRELTNREVAVLEGSCIVPIVGGIIVNAIYDAHPQWEAKPVKVAAVRKKKAKM